jgi:hypothetical protein
MSSNIGAEIVAALQETDTWKFMQYLMSRPRQQFAPQPHNGDFRNVRPDVGPVNPAQAEATRTYLMTGQPALDPPQAQAQTIRSGNVSPKVAAEALALIRGQQPRPYEVIPTGDQAEAARYTAMGCRKGFLK